MLLVPACDASIKLDERYRVWKERFQHPQSYPYRDALDCIGSKWVVLILIALALRPRRFGELKREIPEMSQRVLTQTLRNMEMDGLIRIMRCIYDLLIFCLSAISCTVAYLPVKIQLCQR